jgi:phage terminase large subunit-like protein
VLEDDGWFAYVCQLDPCEKCAADGKQMPTDGCANCDQWTDEKTWIKANPGLDVILTRQYLAGQVKEARGMPTKENIVRRLNFCQWTEQDVRWIPMADWDACPKEIDLPALKKRPCFAGLDLSATSDFTALVLCFPPEGEDDPWIWLPRIWIPGVTAEERERRDRLPITVWERQEFIRMTEGNVVDYDFVIREIEKLGEEYSIQEIGFDSWNATQAANQLKELGFNMVEMRQGAATLNEPCKMLEKLVRSHRLNHGGHPVLRWMASNVVVRLDANANYAPDKAKSGQKIDAIVAGLMGMGRAIRHLEEPVVYSERGFLTT